MENTNDKEIKVGSYVKLKSDPTQIFKVSSWENDIILVFDNKKARHLFNISEIEMGNIDDMVSFDQNSFTSRELDI